MSTTLLLAVVTLFLLTVSQPVDGAGDKGMYLNREAFLDRNRDQTTRELVSEMRVHCTNGGIDVTFRRNMTMHLGVVSPMQLQFSLSSCKASANLSHFTLHTGFSQCGNNLKLSSNNSTATISNTVIIIPPTMFFAKDNSFQGDKGRNVEISFTCTYSDKSRATTRSTNQRTTTSPPTMIHRSNIVLYTTDSFSKEFDLDRPIARGTSLYAEVSAFEADGRAAGFYIDSCYMSLKRHPTPLDTPYYLIKHGCAQDSDVQFKEDADSTPRKFLFRAKRLFGRKPMFLHCTLLLCTTSTHNQCRRQEQYCRERTGDLASPMYRASLSSKIAVVKRRPVVATPQVMRTEPTIPTREAATTRPKRCPPILQPACKCENKAVVDEQTPSTAQTQHVTKGMVSVEVTVGVAIVSFVIGATFIGIMWFIYIRTDPRRKMKSVSMSEDGISSSQDSAVPTEKLMHQCNDVTSSEGSH